MSDYKAYLSEAKIAPRKARLVIDTVRGKPVQTALDSLRLLNKKAAPMVIKLVESAVSSATDRATVDVDRLVIAEAFVDDGPIAYRWLPRAQGRATPLRKRTSNITVKLKEL